MRVLRENNDSLMAILEAFVYDPLISWRLTARHEPGGNGEQQRSNQVKRCANCFSLVKMLEVLMPTKAKPFWGVQIASSRRMRMTFLVSHFGVDNKRKP